MAVELNVATKQQADTILQNTQEIINSIGTGTTDPYDTPGPQDMSYGNMAEGYFGLVQSGSLISGDALASEIGLTQGTAQNSTAGWFKAGLENKILFVAKKTFRYGLSWNQINSAGAVFGSTEVTIKGKKYKVRLMTGGDAEPADKAGGEWNKIMYKLHKDFGALWGSYDDEDLLTDSDHGSGAYSWCQETSASNSDNRVYRGYSGVSGFYRSTASNTNDSRGWRPVLELL